MKKAILFIIFGASLIFYAYPAYGKTPLSYREDKKIMPAYERGKFDDLQSLSTQISNLINQGRLDKAAQILNISGPKRAAAVLLTMELQDSRRLLNFLGIKDATSTFAQIARLNIDYTGTLFAAITRTNPSLGARLYKKLAEGKVNLKAVFKTAAVDEKMLTSLLTAKDKKAVYIISAGGARRLLWDYAAANEKQEWGNIELAALINSGRGAEILFRRLTQKGILEMSDEEKMKVLLNMKPEEAAKIIKNAHPYQAARLLVLMKPAQAARILAEEVLKPKEVKRIIEEMGKQDVGKTEDILKELKVLAPGKV